MSFIYDVLKKAQSEGKLSGFVGGKEKNNISSPQSVFEIPEEIIQDFSRLQEQLELANQNEKTQVLTVASSVSGEGASTVVTYLAMMYAQETNGFHQQAQAQEDTNESAKTKTPLGVRQNLLLIDGNIRHPSLHRIWGLPRERGLTEIVEDHLEFGQAIKQVCSANLGLITSGREPMNATEVIKSGRLRDLIQFVRQEFRRVIIDVAPVTLHADALIYNSLVDGVILVVQAGKTRYEIVQRAKSILQEGNAKILGVVLNRRMYEIPEVVYRRL